MKKQNTENKVATKQESECESSSLFNQTGLCLSLMPFYYLGWYHGLGVLSAYASLACLLCNIPYDILNKK